MKKTDLLKKENMKKEIFESVKEWINGRFNQNWLQYEWNLSVLDLSRDFNPQIMKKVLKTEIYQS